MFLFDAIFKLSYLKFASSGSLGSKLSDASISTFEDLDARRENPPAILETILFSLIVM